MKIVHGFNHDNSTQSFLFLLDTGSQYFLTLTHVECSDGELIEYELYKLTTDGKKEYSLFTGDQYRPSPLYDSLGLDSAIGLLAFLTLKPGDTDSEYFEDYTKLQLNWTQARDCEELSIAVSDYENKDLESIDILALSELI